MSFNLRIKVAFNGGDLPLIGNDLLVKEFNEKVGLHELIIDLR
ncbi:hypothetical protein [Halalkalibacter alkalisediminis]|nr:hypothetical protein [Halalkalibacter alkalisediminis]